jgi:metal transporter CNNM
LTIREIIDESDVFVDVHKAIRRMAPAPRYRVPKGEIVADANHAKDAPTDITTVPEDRAVDLTTADPQKSSMTELGVSPKVATFMMRRRSSGTGSIDRTKICTSDPDFRDHLKHLGPSNVAARPKQTRINTVKIKPGVSSIPEYAPKVTYSPNGTHAPQGGIGEGLLESAGSEAKDGVHSVAVGYGTMGSRTQQSQIDGEDAHGSPKSQTAENNAHIVIDHRDRANSTSTLGSLHSIRSQSPQPIKKRTTARSGSITENFVDMGGVKKMVLEMTSSSEAEEGHSSGNGHADKQNHTDGAGDKAHAGGKKKRKKRASKKKKGGTGESAPLLGGDRS